jgi:hypothetical protein
MTKRHEWDPVTTTTDGRVVWRRYADRKIVVANRSETPDDALKRQSAKAQPKQRSRKP